MYRVLHAAAVNIAAHIIAERLPSSMNLCAYIRAKVINKMKDISDSALYAIQVSGTAVAIAIMANVANTRDFKCLSSHMPAMNTVNPKKVAFSTPDTS